MVSRCRLKKSWLGLERLEERALLTGANETLIVQFDHNPEVGVVGPIAEKEAPFGGLSSDARRVLAEIGAEISQNWLEGRLTEITIRKGIDVAAAMSSLQLVSQVNFATTDDTIALAEFIPNDPAFESQWGLYNANDIDIDATLAWDQTTGHATTIVAVMDSGVDYTHPDLYLALALNEAEIPSALMAQLVDTNSDGQIDFYDLNSLDATGNAVLDGNGRQVNAAAVTDQNGNGYIDAGDLLVAPWSDGIDSDGNGWVDDLTGWDSRFGTNDPMDADGHGTHVAGIIAARGNNGVGGAGVDWQARILPERFNASGAQVSHAIQAIEHAVSLGADIINSSWGTFQDNPALRTAVEWAGQNDVVFVTAAGNHSNNLDDPNYAYYPASYDLPNLISVASVTSAGSLSEFSNFGVNTIDIAAPGSNILSTELGGDYVSLSGTSMATPYVAGVVSLVHGLFPNASAAWLVDRVLSTTRPLASLVGKVSTGGMVDAFSAVNTVNVAGPRVVATSLIGDVVAPSDRVVFTFDRPIAANSFTTDDVSMVGPAGPVLPTGVSRISDFQFEVVFPTQTAVGYYTINVGPQIEDLLGRLMDQDRDGISGEPLEDRFDLVFRQIAAPQFWTIDDGDPEYSTIGNWSQYVGSGAQGDFAYKASGSGTAMASWAFSGLEPGQYRVSATWEAFSNRVTDAPYTIREGSTPVNTVVVNQRLAPADFLEAGVWWQDLGSTYDVFSDSLIVELSDLAGPAGSYLIADAVRIERVGDVVATGPELVVMLDGTSVHTGESVDFGSTEIGTPISKTFTVRNAGVDVLTLGTITLPSGYTLLTNWGTTTLTSGESTSFTVQLDAGASGLAAGTISFDSNDIDENPFTLFITGTVSQGQLFVRTIDDGDPEYSTIGNWSQYVGSGAQGDFAYKASGSGTAMASWAFSGLEPGQYRVSATWEAFSNRVTDAPYTIREGSTPVNTVVVNQRLAPADFLEAGVWWQDLGSTYDVFSDSLIVELSDLAGPAGSYLIADAVRIERVGDVVATGPELVVMLDGTSVHTGESVDFGSTEIGTPISKTFTVRNAGVDVLTLGTITLPSGYTLLTNWGTTTLTSGESTSFTVQLDASASGLAAGTISFDSNDIDENPFTLFITGTVSQGQLFVRTIDDGDPEYSTIGNWSQYVGSGAQGDFAYKASGSGTAMASWAFSGLEPGQYRVSATWEAFSNRVTDAPYTIREGSTPVNTVVVNQRLAPADFLEAGVWWQDLGSTYDVFSDSLIVELSDLAGPAGSYLIADAVRIERVGDVVATGPELVVMLDGTSVHTGESVDFGSTEIGTPISKTFTVRNAGVDVLTLGTITLPSGYTLLTNWGTTTLTSGESTSFTVQLDAGASGLAAGTISFDSNDIDENPFTLFITGTVSQGQLFVRTIDDGDPEYSTIGNWSQYVGSGAQGDFAYKASGSGTAMASWAFSGLEPGQYRVSATWEAFSNRVTDAPYTIREGSTPVNTVVVNQRLAPADFLEAGVWWQDLGSTYDVFSDSLIVELSDLAGPAGSYLIADAVRIERVGDVVATGPELVVMLDGTSVHTGESVDFGSTEVGTPISKTFTVRNAGVDVLTLGTITLPSGYTPLTNWSVHTVVVNQRRAPADFLEAGVSWQDLGSTHDGRRLWRGPNSRIVSRYSPSLE